MLPSYIFFYSVYNYSICTPSSFVSHIEIQRDRAIGVPLCKMLADAGDHLTSPSILENLMSR